MSRRETGWLLLGVFIGVVGGIVIGVPMGMGTKLEAFDHDPQKLLELRVRCLKDDPSISTAYCDRYAELYSRVQK